MSPLQAFMLKRVAKNQAIKKKVKLWLRVHLTLLLFAGGGFLLLMMIILMLVGAMLVDSDSPDSSCSGGGSSSYDIGSSISGTDGSLDDKNSKEYKASKEIYEAGLNDGLDAKHSSAMTGNGLEESGMFGVDVGEPFSTFPHQSSGPGLGIFQFNNPPSNHSIQSQVDAILRNDLQGTKSSFEHASGSVSELAEDFRADFEGGDVNPMRQKYANKIYQMFGGIKGGSTSSDTSDTASTGSSSCGDDSTADTSGIVAYAKKWIGGLPYSNGDRASGAWAVAKGDFSKKKTAGADCSSFQWGVYRHQGFKTSPQPWAGDIYPPCKVISGSSAKPGDTVILGNKDSGDDGHVMILESRWYGKNNKTKVINEGGDGSDVNESGFADASLSIMNKDALHFVAPVKD